MSLRFHAWRALVWLLLSVALGMTLRWWGVTHALTPEEQLSGMRDACEDRMFLMLQEERDAYRKVQYGGKESVLHTPTVNTTDLVPYLVLNYHALSCRLNSVCDAVELSHGHIGTGTVPPHRPIGCARLFAARGRWWNEDRRDLGFNVETIPECAYSDIALQAPGFGVTFDYPVPKVQCTEWVQKILEEERQFLRLLVAQDAAHRGTRRVVAVLQSVLRDIRDSFLEPLRGVVDLFGAVVHPIPCLLTQCN